jgi:DNA (cytosine-5)-methyltransferase 1
MVNLILSLFPGIDLLGMGFEEAGFTVVRGPDPIFGGDIRCFHPPEAFEGIIGGSPCQDFSKLRRTPPTGYGAEMLAEFHRCVTVAKPEWFLLENVPGVPRIEVRGYQVQRIHVRASEFGAAQHRLRILQFGYRDGAPLILSRPVTKPTASARAALASEGTGKDRRAWAEFCALQGLVPAPKLDSFTQAARYRAVGNGVYIPMARAVAMSIRARGVTSVAELRPCMCQCGRPVLNTVYATVACRKRAQRMRDAAGATSPKYVTRDPAAVTGPGPVIGDPSPRDPAQHNSAWSVTP